MGGSTAASDWMTTFLNFMVFAAAESGYKYRRSMRPSRC
jgi:hypothetical protein